MKEKASNSPMTSPKAVLKSVGPKLVPFFKTVAIYFVLFIPNTSPSWFACLIKCLPVVSLCVFVLLHGMTLGLEYAYSRRILLGLIASCVGDAILLYRKYFIPGMIAFGIAHCLYISAFTFHPSPLNPYAGAFCFAFCAACYTILWPYLHGVMAICVSMYVALIGTMVWRAIARVQLFEDLWTWTKLCSCAGGIFFVVSDALIGVDHFIYPFPYSQVLIMTTYYAAQLGIALSVVDSYVVAKTKAPISARKKPQLPMERSRHVEHVEESDDTEKLVPLLRAFEHDGHAPETQEECLQLRQQSVH